MGFKSVHTQVAAVAILVVTGSGCTAEQKLGYEPRVSAPEKERTTVEGVSDAIRDWMGINGKRTGGQATETACFAPDKEVDEYYAVIDIWSIYDLTSGSYRDAMENLREKLPVNGWKITYDGPAKSELRQPRITAIHPKTHLGLSASWYWKQKDPKDELIYMSIDSRCMKKPEPKAE